MSVDRWAENVLEEICVRGYIFSDHHVLSVLPALRGSLGVSADIADYADWYIKNIKLTNVHKDPEIGVISATARPREEWLAVHEAGHALVGVRGGKKIWGVRFNREGKKGETVFESLDVVDRLEEIVLRREVRVSVAANLAELMCEHPADGGRPSQSLGGGRPQRGIKYPTDIIHAWEEAKILARIKLYGEDNHSESDEVWDLAGPIVEQAETEADEIMRKNRGPLEELARALRNGPMTGTAVRAILG
jgi:hypothetical protein